MVVLLLLLISLVVFRAAGAFGATPFSTWQDSARYALALMFLFTSSAHFTPMKHDLARMVPKWFPRPLLIVYITGVLEIIGAAGLLLPAFHSAAGLALVVLMLAMFPANVRAARQGIPLRGKAPTELWLRAPMQILFIVLTWWSTQPLRVFGEGFGR